MKGSVATNDIDIIKDRDWSTNYEWVCPICLKAYHQSKGFGDKNAFKEWIKGHKERCRIKKEKEMG